MKYILLLAMAFSGPFYDRDNGRTISVRSGDVVTVKLAVPAGPKGISGIWTLTSPPSSVLIRGRSYMEPNGPDSKYQVFTWTTVNRGSTEVRMQYTGRPFPPRELYTLRILVN